MGAQKDHDHIEVKEAAAVPAGKRAWLYVRRHAKRTALLFLLLTSLMTVSLLGLALHTASSAAVKELRGGLGGYFIIQTGADGSEKTGDALLDQVKTLDNISQWNGVDTYYMYTKGLELVPGANYGTRNVGAHMPKFIGCLDSSLHERFLSASFQLTEGRHITPDDSHKAMISEDIAERNGLAVGDTITGSVVEGVRDWRENAYGTQAAFEIVGIYAAAREEVVSAMTQESEIQENIVFTDISAAKELFLIRRPERTAADYTYSSGLMLFLEDPARMEETVSRLKQQPWADWAGLVISENSAAYRQAAGPIQKAAAISLFLLVVLLVLSIVILSLVLLMWLRERMTEIGVLISLGLSARDICGQMLLENYMVAAPAYVLSALLGAVLAGQAGRLAGGVLDSVRMDPAQALLVLACAAAVILATVLLTSVSIMRKRPKDILTDLS